MEITLKNSKKEDPFQKIRSYCFEKNFSAFIESCQRVLVNVLVKYPNNLLIRQQKISAPNNQKRINVGRKCFRFEKKL